MEIPDFLLGILVLYFLIITMLVIGALSKYTSEQIRRTQKEDRIKILDKLFATLLLGFFSGAIVIIYYNWVNCSFFECHQLDHPNFFNGWFLSAIEVMFIGIIVLVSCKLGKWILIHKKT